VNDNKEFIINKQRRERYSVNYWDNFKIHLGDLKTNNNNSIFDTLVDFFIMSKSSEIISNNSGFSLVISEIYDIKYTIL
jgi:hypothetical protein